MQVTKLPTQKHQLFVFGENTSRFPFFSQFRHTHDPSQPFEAAIVVSEVSDEELYSTLNGENRLLCPIINLSGRHLPREDFYHPSVSRLSVADGLSEVAPIIQRVAELPEITSEGDRGGLMALALAHTRGLPIEARLAPQLPEMVDYPLLRGMPNLHSLLSELADAELLRPRFFQRVHVCGPCASSRLIVREECSECRSSDLEEEHLVHHYRCGSLRAESEFRQGSELVCPKCHRQLRHYGVDYDKPGSVQRCKSCGHTSSEPSVGFLCGDCGFEQDATSADTRDWFHYDLLPAALDALRAGLLPYRSLATVMSLSFGAYSIRDFTAAAQMLLRVSGRYKRSLTGFGLTITNAAELTEKLGGSGLNGMFSRLGEIISQILRESDLITATNQAVYALLPETSEENAKVAVARIEEGVRKSISQPMAFDVVTYTQETIEDMLAELR